MKEYLKEDERKEFRDKFNRFRKKCGSKTFFELFPYKFLIENGITTEEDTKFYFKQKMEIRASAIDAMAQKIATT